MIIKYPKHLLSQHELRRMVFYDPDTGIMTWLASCGVWTNGRRVGWISSKGYRRAMIGQVAYPFTHLVWLYVTGAWPEREIDHENLCKSDDRWRNLRPATHSQNGHNRPCQANNKLGVKGVYRLPLNGKFRAQIGIRGRRINLGDYETPDEASAAYEKAQREAVGDYARIA